MAESKRQDGQKLSVVIMTFNEAANIGRCITALGDLADDLLVVDSFSTDDTVAIAQSLGARTILHPFEGYTHQRIFCIENANYDLVLTLDADEWLSEEAVAEIREIKKERRFDCYQINRLNSIGGQWMRHGGWHPDWKLRLFDRHKAVCIGAQPHDRMEPVKGATVAKLRGKLYHASDKNISVRVVTIDRHSTTAAKHLFQTGKRTNLFRLLLKPVFRFLSEYVFQLGFLDGFYGFVVAKTSAQYVFLREAKLWELQKK